MSEIENISGEVNTGYDHSHEHEHENGHENENGHGHDHKHEHEHEHEQKHNHKHNHKHEHEHEHEQKHEHEHEQKHEHENKPEHEHNHEHGGEHDSGNHRHEHGHYHSPEVKKKQINRLAKAIGHLQHVKKMLENDEDCSDVLIQLAAVRSALNGLGKEIISEHMTHCIYHAVENGDMLAVEEFREAVNKFL